MPKPISHIRYYSGGEKCPCCSTERDRGGVLVLKVSKYKNKNGNPIFHLRCPVCKYSVNKNQTSENHVKPAEKHKTLSTMGL